MREMNAETMDVQIRSSGVLSQLDMAYIPYRDELATSCMACCTHSIVCKLNHSK